MLWKITMRRLKGYNRRFALISTIFVICTAVLILFSSNPLFEAGRFGEWRQFFGSARKDLQLESPGRFSCLSDMVSAKIGKSLSLLRDRPQQHVAFLKVHKSASSTMQNVFYRYGVTRNLSFILPEANNQLRFSIQRGKHAKLIPAPGNGTKYDMLANHAVFDENVIPPLLNNDTTYIAIMREPSKNFISGVLYFTYKYPQPYLKVIPKGELFPLLIRFPEKYEPKNLRFSFTYNMQANDLGLTLDRVKRIDHQVIQDYLSKLNDIFSLVLLADYFDESIVLMKRYLNWDLKDILYIKVNEFHTKKAPNLTSLDKKILLERNYLDYSFYEFFYKRFWSQMSCEKADIMEEVGYFKRVKKEVTNYCRTNKTSRRDMRVGASKWNRVFSVSVRDCRYMMTSELDFFTKLQKIQRSRVKKLDL